MAAISDAVGDGGLPDSPVLFAFFFFLPPYLLSSLFIGLDVGGAGGGFVQVEHR